MKLKNNYTTVHVLYELKFAKVENNKFQNQFTSLKNETNEIDDRVSNIEQFKNIQSLQDLQTVKQQIQRITAQTASLSHTQFARNQDLLAPYNLTSVR